MRESFENPYFGIPPERQVEIEDLVRGLTLADVAVYTQPAHFGESSKRPGPVRYLKDRLRAEAAQFEAKSRIAQWFSDKKFIKF